MMKKNHRQGRLLVALLFTLFMGISTIFANSNFVKAAGYDDVFTVVNRRANTQNVYRCYKNGAVNNVVPLDKYSTIQSLLAKPSSKLPRTGFDEETCKTIFNKYKSKAPSSTAGADKVEEFVKNVGYKVTGSSKSGECHYLTFTYYKNGKKVGKRSSTKICQNKAKTENWEETFKSSNVSFYLKNNNKTMCLRLFNKVISLGDKCRKIDQSAKNVMWKLLKDDSEHCKSKDGSITCEVNKYYKAEFGKLSSSAKTTSSLNGSEGVISESEKKNKKIDTNARKIAGKTATKFFTGRSLAEGSVGADSLMARLLYQGYLKNKFGLTVVCNKDKFKGDKKNIIQWYTFAALNRNDTKTQECYYDTDKMHSTKNKANGLDSNGFMQTEKFLLNSKMVDGTWENYLKALKKEGSYSESEVKEAQKLIEAVDDEEKEGTETTSADGDVCYEGSGALGWILCPVIKGLSAAGEFMWKAVSEMLNIPAREMFADSKGVFQAWDIVKNIANVMFIILFLIVIFSQLTGVGIDNYGIKRVLPKIIIAAILINLSYVICELAVDISNILGSGLQNMFASQAGTIDLGKEAPAGSAVAGGIVDLALVGSGAYLYTLFNPLGTIAIGIAVVSVIISIVVAVAFLFLILVIRQAGVIIMVVLAPAAIACYMLPNTEKLFKKWFDLFKALLVVFPICGAIVGAGALASAVLGSIDNTAMKVAAMIVQVVPFFLIPTLLKQSLSLMGNIGAGLQGVAGRMRRGASGAAGNAMKNSEMLQSLDNKLGMHSLSSKRRAAAFDSEMSLRDKRFRRVRHSDRDVMMQRLADADADNEAKAINEDVERKVISMERNGITMSDGTKASYSLVSAEGRARELEKISRGRALTSGEQVELSALAKGMAGMKGGAGKLAKIVRHAGETVDENGRVVNKRLNSNFMSAMGEIYSRDSDVKNKMNEKDMGASIYTEQFMPGGDVGQRPTDVYSDFAGPVSNDEGNEWKGALDGRIKTYAAGLGQSGEATEEYLKTLTRDDCNRIVNDEILYNGLDNDNRAAFDKYARDNFGIEPRNGGVRASDSSSSTIGGATGGSTGSGEGELIIDPHAADEAFRRGRESGEFKLPK